MMPTYAYILGLFGNPSDGFHGKTVSMLIGNFAAKVTLTPSKKLKLVRDR
jgi:glucuronokinase